MDWGYKIGLIIGHIGVESVKSENAFKTIREVSVKLDLPQHVLRFWETKFRQLNPVKNASGRRYYRPEDVALIMAIRDLIYRDGLTIRGVQKILNGLVSNQPLAQGAKSQLMQNLQTDLFENTMASLLRQSAQRLTAQNPSVTKTPLADNSAGFVTNATSRADEILTDSLMSLRTIQQRLFKLGEAQKDQ